MTDALTLAEAVAGSLPDGLVAVPVRPDEPDDVVAVTELMRDAETAACGQASSNTDEVRDELGGPECGWARGAALVRGGSTDGPVVGAALVFDGLAEGRGFLIDPYARTADPRAGALLDALVGAMLAEGRRRYAGVLAGGAAPAAPTGATAPVAKAGCYAGEVLAPAAYRTHGFEEVRRFWRMRIDHAPRRVWNPPLEGPIHAHRGEGYVLRGFRADDEADWIALHELGQAAFLDHWDSAPQSYATWRAQLAGVTEDPTQWLVVEHDGALVAYVRGNDRYATEGWGYVASIGVARAHRGLGLARALLRARFADDLARGRAATTLHVDSSSPTGATRLYEGVGMHVDEEIIAFHRPLLD